MNEKYIEEKIEEKIESPQIIHMIYDAVQVLKSAFTMCEEDNRIEWENNRMFVGYPKTGFGATLRKLGDISISKGERDNPNRRSILITWGEDESDD
jgi:hypothetical protein